LSLPRRWLLDFENNPSDLRELMISLIGVSTMLLIFEITIRFTLMRGQRPIAPVSAMAAFVLFGAWFCCYHFMYYDVLLTALPASLLLAQLSRYLQPRFVIVQDSDKGNSQVAAPAYYLPRWASEYSSAFATREARFSTIWVLSSFTLSLILLVVLAEEFAPAMPLSISVSAGNLDSRLVPMP